MPHEQGPRSKLKNKALVNFLVYPLDKIFDFRKDPNEMMMMMALTGQNPGMMGGMPPQAMMGR